jgi:WD40 repeat protein
VSGFFGPLTHPRQAVDEDDFENVRKRQIDDDQHQNQNGPAGKRARLSNGYENGFESTPKSPMEMDVDEEQNGDGNAYPSPEQVPSPAVVTTGPETGTQIEKVAELGSETTFLDLSDDSSAKNAVLLQCEFSPRDPTILAAAGTDALARMWTLSRTVPNLNPNEMETDLPTLPQRPPYLSLLDEGTPSSTNVTSLSWSSDGNLIAVASEQIDDNIAKVDIWTLEGTSISPFSGLEASVLSLKWNPTNTLLLVLSPISITGGILITVWVAMRQECVRYSLPGLNGVEQSLDAVWRTNWEFVLCGGDILQEFLCNEDSVSPLRKYETRDGHALSKVTYDWHSRLLATASETGMIDVSFLEYTYFVSSNNHIDLGPTRRISLIHCSPGIDYSTCLATISRPRTFEQ